MVKPSRGFVRRTVKRRVDTSARDMTARLWLAFIGLLLSLAVTGCADTGAASDNDKRGVFYGGISGGRTWP